MSTQYEPGPDLPARKGTWAWAIPLLTLVAPGIGALVAGIAAVFAYHFYNKQDDRGAVNARNAANFAASYALLTLACALVFFVIVPLLGGLFPSVGTTFLLLGVMALGVWAIWSIVVVVLSVMGIVAAVQGRVFDSALALRLIKGPRVFER